MSSQGCVIALSQRVVIAFWVCRLRGNWTMEEWLAYVETFAPYLLYDLPWKAEDAAIRAEFEREWALLRRGTLHALRHHCGQHTSQRIEAARQALANYAAAAEQVCLLATIDKLRLASPHQRCLSVAVHVQSAASACHGCTLATDGDKMMCHMQRSVLLDLAAAVAFESLTGACARHAGI